MLPNIKDTYYTSDVLQKCPDIIHGFSTKTAGDMREPQKRSEFAQNIGLGVPTIYMPQQIHGNVVSIVTGDSPERVLGVDGLIIEQKFKKNIAIGVLAADCIPLVFADRKGRSIAVAHAGWRGTLGAIGQVVILEMIKLGSDPSDIMVSIGPHIGRCCYTVPEDRAEKFLQEYGDDANAMGKKDGIWYLDIGYINVMQFRRLGVPMANIETPITCTKCQENTYYSYRRDTKATFGEMIGMIGFSK